MGSADFSGACFVDSIEIAVKAGVCDSVMTTYGSLNGTWTSSCYDLNTVILRDQWGFKGIVMTDWWAMTSEEGGQGERNNFAAMVRAQNDLYMVCPDSSKNRHGDNLEEALADGRVTIAELQRCAKNICGQAMNMYAYERLNGNEAEIEANDSEESFKEETIDVEFINGGMEYTYDLTGFNGQKEIAAELTRQALETMPELDVVDKLLIPALDRIGEQYRIRPRHGQRRRELRGILGGFLRARLPRRRLHLGLG